MKRNYVINYCCALLALILIVCGVGVFFINIKAPKAAQPISETELSDIEPLEYYRAEFLIVDIYAYYGDSIEDAKAYFCYALVKDKHGNTNAVSISTAKVDSIFEAVKEYACDEEAQIGDLVIECAAKAQRTSAYASYIDEWYKEGAETYNEMLGVLTTASMNYEFVSEPDEFIAVRKAELKVMLIISMICTAVGAVFAFAAFLIPGIKKHSAQPWLWEQDQNNTNEITSENTESNE